MSANDVTPAGQPEPGDVTPGDQPPDPFDYTDPANYVDDTEWIGDVPSELTPEQEARRDDTYKHVQRLAGEYGIPVFPIWQANEDGSCACPEGAGCERAGKHPIDSSWYEMATDDPEQAARWWRPLGKGEEKVDWRPKSNVGELMGIRHFLLDVDMGEGQQGDLTLDALISHHGGEDIPFTLMYDTGSGGRQYVFLRPEGVEVRNSVSELGNNLDVRGHRGFGIAPPSRSGKGLYRDRVNAQPALPPGWLTRWLVEQQEKRTRRLESLPKGDNDRPLPKQLSARAQGYIDGALRSAVKAVTWAPDHERNNVLNRESFNIFAKYGVVGLLDPGEIATALKEAAQACGLRGVEIPRTLQSAWEGAQNKPRSGELPDWIYEEYKPKLPSLASMIYEFERLYDLRRTVTGEFVSRPSGLEVPPLTTDIGEELGYLMRRWWRARAEEWEQCIAEMTANRQVDPDKPDDKDEPKEHGNPFQADAAFTTATSHLRASAAQHDLVEQHLRVVDVPGRVIVDLCDSAGQVAVITADGWEVTDPRLVVGKPWFKRNPAMRPQVLPARVAPADVVAILDEARDVLGFDDGQWVIALCGLIGAYFPSIARPGWWLAGPSGVGKTTRGEMLTGLVDPMRYLGGRLNLRRDERNARTKAVNTFVFTLDNASSITQDESDFWCTMHTGAAEQVRKLNSDNTMLSFEYRRIGLGTSRIMPRGFQSDALRRMLLIQLRGTDDHPDVGAIKAKYAEIKPRVIGALFCVISGILANLGKAMAEDLDGVPEMSDFARRLRAADLAIPGLAHTTGKDGQILLTTGANGQVLGLFEAYREHAIDVLVSAGLENPLVLMVIKLVENHELMNPGPLAKPLTKLPADLLNDLRKVAGDDIQEKWFPIDATRMGEKLIDMDGPLRRLGIAMGRAKHTNKGTPYTFTRTTVPKGDAGDSGSDAGNGVSIT